MHKHRAGRKLSDLPVINGHKGGSVNFSQIPFVPMVPEHKIITRTMCHVADSVTRYETNKSWR